MMLIQLILICAIVFSVVKFLSSQSSANTKAMGKILLLVFTAVSALMIIEPSLLNDIAHFVGVGRGADLLLYGLAVGFIFNQLHNYVKSQEQKRAITALARNISLLETQIKDGKK